MTAEGTSEIHSYPYAKCAPFRAMRKQVLVAVISAVMAMTLIAPAAEATAVWQISRVKYVYPLSDGTFIIALIDNPPSCTNTANPKYLLVSAGQNGVTADAVKNMLATTLTAFALDAQLQVNFDDATGNCFVNRIVLAR